MQNRDPNALQICPRHTQYASQREKGGGEIQYCADVHNNSIIFFLRQKWRWMETILWEWKYASVQHMWIIKNQGKGLIKAL